MPFFLFPYLAPSFVPSPILASPILASPILASSFVSTRLTCCPLSRCLGRPMIPTRPPIPNIRASSSSAAPNDPAAAAPLPASSRTFVITRSLTFAAMALTYACYVFLRSTFTYVAPSMASSLGLSLSAVGKITSAFPLAYAMSRLCTGLLVDNTRPHIALAIGLFLAAILNLLMGFSSAVPAFALLWALNGLVQGVGAGASAKMLTAWFTPNQRGFYWALWSTSANVGAFAAPLACATLASRAGFRYGLIVPAIATASWAVLSALFLKSSPADAGFQPLAQLTSPDSQPTKQPSQKLSSSSSWRSIFVNGVLKNRTIWALAVAYFFVYLIRSGTKSWLHFWLVDAKNYAIADAATRVSGMEVGGIAGTFSAGVVSDWLGGRRVIVTLLYLSGVIMSLAASWAFAGHSAIIDFLSFAAVGFFINGPQMVIGLIGAEVCDPRVVATATGVLGWISYLGAATSGFPLSIIIRNRGWPSFFIALLASCVCAMLCLAPMWRMKATASDKGR